MCFKRLFAALWVVASLASCGIHLGEKPADNPTISYSGQGYACMGEISSHIEKYMNDTLSEVQINDFVRCLQRSFISFASLTRGRDQATYSPDEIRSFLEGYFLKQHISDSLLHQFMVIKQLLVGGSVERISRVELSNAVEILEDVRVEALRLKPHLRYLNPRLVKNQGEDDIGAQLYTANQALRTTIQTFTNRLKLSTATYQLADMQTFLSGFREYVGWQAHFPNAPEVSTWIDLFKNFKIVNVSEVNPQAIQPAEWEPMLDSIVNWYFCFMQYQVGIKGQPISHGVGLQNTWYMAQQVFGLLDRAVDPRTGHTTLTFAQIAGLTKALYNLKWLPEGIRDTSLNQAIAVGVTRVFGDTNRLPSQRTSKGLNSRTIANMRNFFDDWFDVQMDLNSEYQMTPRISKATVPSLQLPEDKALLFGPFTERAAGPELADFLEFKKYVRPLFVDNASQVSLVTLGELKTHGPSYDFYDLSMMNGLRAIVSLVFRGYADDQSGRWTWTAGLTSAELQAFYKDVYDFGVDLGLLDQRVTNAGSRAFVEAKLFTYSSTGLAADGSLTPLTAAQTTEYLGFLYSGGKTASALIANLRYCTNGPLDITHLPTVARSCVISDLPSLIINGKMPDGVTPIFANMPGLQAYLRTAPPDVRRQFAQTVMGLATTSFSNPDWMEQDEFNNMSVIMHYIEAVMTRYENAQGLLANDKRDDQVSVAYPVFEGFIKSVLKNRAGYSEIQFLGIEDKVARGAFTYILANRSLPPEGGFASLLSLAEILVTNPTVSLDRYNLAMVFKAFIEKLRATAPTPPPPPSAQAIPIE